MTAYSRTKPPQDIILDTNILQYSIDKHILLSLSSYISDLLKRGFGLAISNISAFEILAGVDVKKEERLLNLLNQYNKYDITDEVLIGAAQLQTLYGVDKILPTQISIGDKLIASTSILTGSLIMTVNGKDFPWPFFSELERNLIIYTKNKRSHVFMVGLFAPDLVYINNCFSKRPKG